MDLPVPTQTTQLGDFNDVAPTDSSSVVAETYGTIHKSLNLTTFDLDKVLERAYTLDPYDWPTAHAEGALIAGLDFPKVLFDQPFIKAKLGDFRYFKAGVRVSVRVITNQFAYGKLMGIWIPTANLVETADKTALSNMSYASGWRHVLISASAGEAITFDFPFISIKRVLELNDYAIDAIGRFELRVLNPLRMVDGTVHTGQVQITVGFKDAMVALPTNYFVPESAGEADFKASLSTISDVANIGKAITSIVDDPGSAKPYEDFMAAAIPPALSIVGLSKPMTLEQTKVQSIQPFSDMNYGSGISLATKFAVDPKCSIGTSPIVGKPIDEMAISAFVGTPQMTKIITLQNNYNVQIVDRLEYDTNCYLDHFAKFFQYAHGTRKFKLYFTASQFHKVQVVLWINHEATHNDAKWSNCHFQVIDVQKDSEVEFSVPYMGPHYARQTKDAADMHLYVRVLSWNQPDASKNCPIYMNVYKAGDTDYKFSGYLDKFITESDPQADFAKPFPFFATGMTNYETQNLTSGENILSLRELVHKYHPYESLGNVRTKVYNPDKVGGRWGGIEKFGKFFMYYRGSMRIRITFRSANICECIFSSIGETAADSDLCATDISTQISPQLNCEIPFYDRDPFRPTSNLDTPEHRQWFQSSAATSFLFKAAGDDFSFFYMRPLNPSAYVAKSDTGVFTMKNLHSFYSS